MLLKKRICPKPVPESGKIEARQALLLKVIEAEKSEEEVLVYN